MRLWDSVKAAASGVEDDGSFESPIGPEDCQARRAAALRVAAEDLDLPDGWGDEPYGVVVEVGGSRGVTTILAFATGEASLLTASGSGMIGRPSHVHVVIQARRLVEMAAGHVALAAPIADFPFPPEGAARFYFLTRKGVLTAEESVWELRSGGHSLSPLMDASDELMSEFTQYLWVPRGPVSPAKPIELLKAVAMVAAIGALTYAAWLIPIAWVRWPAVAIGAFFTIAAAIVPVAMLVAPRLSAEEPEPAAPG